MTGLDTETHKGRVVLIATPRDYLEVWRYRERDQWPCLIDWLSRQDEKFVCWNADYDIQACLKLLTKSPNEDLWRLTRVDHNGYRIRFVPSKFATIGVLQRGKKESKTLFTIFDLCQFYASTLESASRRILGRPKGNPGVSWDKLFNTLRIGPTLRRQWILDYCLTDSALVEEIYQKSDAAMVKAGVSFHRPVSCASIAVQKFSKTMKHSVPREINNVFEKTYRGGRIECLQTGYFSEAYFYDIHSAYPSSMAVLPAVDGAWLPIEKRIRPDAVYVAVLVHLQVPYSEYRCPVAVQGETQFLYPTGQWPHWVDLATYRLLEEKGFITKIVKGWQMVGGSERKPFADLADMYLQRQLQPDQSWALKIIMNALSGKVAQRIKRWRQTDIVHPWEVESWKGEFWRRKEQWTKSTNFIYVSSITAQIRTRLYREINPNTCIFYATDGVMCSSKMAGLSTGSGLGEWSVPEKLTDLVVVGSGVYTYKRADGSVCTKVRGFEVGLDLYKLLDRKRRILTLEVKRNWTLAQSLRQHKFDHFNEIVSVPRYLDVCFDRKRIWEKNRVGRDLLQRSFSSRPWTYYPSVRYEEFN